MADTYDPSENDHDCSVGSASDLAAFQRIHRDLQERIHAFACRILGGDNDAAADVTQETFLRFWRQRHAYREQGTLPAYLLRIAYNLCLDRLRARRPQQNLDTCTEIAVDGDSVEDTIFASVFSEAVLAAVANLPNGQRDVFILSHYEQRSYREIAAALGCPIGTVASRKFLAIEALRKALRSWLSDKG